MRGPRTLDRLNDRLNPIVVKELRQAVQSRFIVGVLLLFLLVQLVVIGLVVGATDLADGRLEAIERHSGREVFTVLNGILYGTCVLLIPAYTGVRLAAERSDTNVDLLFISTLSPRAIVHGKLLAALTLVVLIFSAFTPFLFFTYLLRGIDVPSILWALGLELLAVLGAVQLAIFVAVIPASRFLRIVLGLAAFGLTLGLLDAGLVGIYGLLLRGVGGVMEAADAWAVVVCALTGWLGVVGLLYTWSLALLSPPAANRALVPRLFVAALWLVGALVFAGAELLLIQDAVDQPLLTWRFAMALLFALQIVIAVNERGEWTPRVARTIPRSRWLRVPAFLFYSGAAGGLTFAVLGFALTLGAAQLWKGLLGLRGPESLADAAFDVYARLLLAFGLYVLAYALSAVFVRRMLPVRIHPAHTWVVMVVLVVLGCAVSGLSYFFLFRRWNYESDYPWVWLNPFVVFYEAGTGDWRHGASFLTFAGVWAAVAAVLNLPWFVRQVRRFRPYSGPAATTARRREYPVSVPGAVTRSYHGP